MPILFSYNSAFSILFIFHDMQHNQSLKIIFQKLIQRASISRSFFHRNRDNNAEPVMRAQQLERVYERTFSSKRRPPEATQLRNDSTHMDGYGAEQKDEVLSFTKGNEIYDQF